MRLPASWATHVENTVEFACRTAFAYRAVSHVTIPVDVRSHPAGAGRRWKRNVPNLDAGAERRVLDRAGLDYEVLAAGCCGMAGSFGFETAKYELSQAAAERVLLPRVRQAAPDTLILANGYSCREQIEQGTGRATTHVAELLAEAAGLDPETAA